MITINELDKVRGSFEDLSNSVKALADNNKDYFTSIQESLEGFKKVTRDALNPEYITSIRDSLTKLQDLSTVAKEHLSGIDGLNKDFTAVVESVGGLEKKFDDLLKKVEIKKPKRKKKEPFIKNKYLRSEIKGVQGQLGKAASTFKIPKPGNILAGLIGWMAYGYMDKDRVRAEAGEIKNILIAASDSGVKGSVGRATRYLSGVQENLQRFYGISRAEFQNTQKAYVDGGVRIDQMLSRVGEGIKGVESNYNNLAFALDKVYELPGGASAGRMVSYMRDFGKSLFEAKESALQLYSAAQDSGIGVNKFVDYVETASGSLSKMGFSMESTIDFMVNLQDHFEKAGAPKQFAGKQAFQAFNDIAQGLGSASKDWQVIIAERLGYGQGMEGRMKFMETWTRVIRDKQVDEFEDVISGVVEFALEGAEDDPYKAMNILDTSLGLGVAGARGAYEFYQMKQSGDYKQSREKSRDLLSKISDSMETEREKFSKFQEGLNKWLKGIANVGQAMLAMVGDTLATLIAYFRALPELFGNVFSYFSGGREKNAKIMDKVLSFSGNMGMHFDKMVRGFEKMGSASKELGMDILGEAANNIRQAASFNVGKYDTQPEQSFRRATRAAEAMPPQVSVIAVPVDRGAEVPVPMPEREPMRRGALDDTFMGGSEDERDWVGGGLMIKSDGVDTQGNIRLSLTGNCPRCGLVYEGASRGLAESPRASERVSQDTFDSEYRPDAKDYTDTVNIVDKGAIGGRFRFQSLRPGAKEGRAHGGIDINAPKGTSIYSPESGTVIHVGDAKGAGKNIQIMHPGGETSWLMHMDYIPEDFKPGTQVKRGQYIGDVGTTTGGKAATSPHIHYEVLKPGVSTLEDVKLPASGKQENFGLRMDPLEFFKSVGASPFEEG